MNIVKSWVTIDELEGTYTIIDSIDSSGTKYTKQFTYRQPLGLRFKYRHQVDDHKNGIHLPISL